MEGGKRGEGMTGVGWSMAVMGGKEDVGRKSKKSSVKGGINGGDKFEVGMG